MIDRLYARFETLLPVDNITKEVNNILYELHFIINTIILDNRLNNISFKDKRFYSKLKKS